MFQIYYDVIIMLPIALYLSVIDSDENRDKLTVIYDKYLGTMSKIARQYVAKYQAEGDVVHNAILKIIDNLDKIDLDYDVGTYCYVCKITKSCAIDWLRKENKYLCDDICECDYMVKSDEPLPLDKIISEEGYNYLIQCIRSMSETYRDVCELKFVCGLKEREIAKVLNISEKNVSVRIVRGRKLLIDMLKEKVRK